LYWSNLDQIYPPTDRQINLVDILQEGLPQDSVLSEGRLRWFLSDKGQQSLKKGYCTLDAKKAGCLTARSDASWNSNYVTRQGKITKLTPEEYEKLQTLPMGYTSMVSSSNRYKAIGNGWTVDVIAHILPQILHI
jgi:DNA (cytosine-5)-methyltransferase 3A